MTGGIGRARRGSAIGPRRGEANPAGIFGTIHFPIVIRPQGPTL